MAPGGALRAAAAVGVRDAQWSRGSCCLAGHRSFHNVHSLAREEIWDSVDCRKGCLFPLKCFVCELNLPLVTSFSDHSLICTFLLVLLPALFTLQIVSVSHANIFQASFFMFWELNLMGKSFSYWSSRRCILCLLYCFLGPAGKVSVAAASVATGAFAIS